MSIHLVGGGRDEEYDGEVYREFLREATTRGLASGRQIPRVGLLVVREDADAASALAAHFTAQFARVAPCETVATAIVEGELFMSGALTTLDALMIAGGHTPSYLDAVTPIVEEIRLLVADGLPYLGFSAGAMIAAESAIIGGWRIDDTAVCPEDAAEDLEEVTVAEGLGLVDLAVDVHAAQWGTLSRLVAATEAGLVEGGIAIDEFTAIIVDDDELRVVGSGSVWQVTTHDDGVLVSALGA